MLQSRLGAKLLGSPGPHAKTNCINARQPNLSVNKSLSTETCFSLTNIFGTTSDGLESMMHRDAYKPNVSGWSTFFIPYLVSNSWKKKRLVVC